MNNLSKIFIILFFSWGLLAKTPQPNGSSVTLFDVRSTIVEPDFFQPWEKRTPYTRKAKGILINERDILVPESSIQYATQIEIKSAGGDEWIPASLKKTDETMELAIVTTNRPLQNTKPVTIRKERTIPEVLNIIALDDQSRVEVQEAKYIGVETIVLGNPYVSLPIYTIQSQIRSSIQLSALQSKEELVGVAVSYNKQKRIAKVIPGFLIQKFINCMEKDCNPYSGFTYLPIEDESTKNFQQIKSKKGVQVARVLYGGAGYGILQTGDVLTKVAGLELDFQGKVKDPILGEIPFPALFSLFDQKMNKGYISIHYIRNGEEFKTELPLAPFPRQSVLIPFDKKHGYLPQYKIIGGYVWSELSEFLLEVYGKNWKSKADKRLLYLTEYHKLATNNENIKPIVLLQVLPDSSNEGFQYLSMSLLKTINGETPKDIKHLKELVTKISREDMIIFTLVDGTIIPINKKDLNSIHKNLTKQYGITIQDQ
jgi:hypothetical protein